MNCRWSIAVAALTLGGCGQADPEPSAQASAQASSTTAQAATPGGERAVAGSERRVLAFGDSLFAGYGVGMENSYPAQLQAALRADGMNVTIANAGVSGDTSAAGRQRLAFTLDAQTSPPDLVLLELGANDMLRAVSPAETRANIAAMLDELAKRDIPVLLMGMRAPPNYGPEYQRAFDAIYTELGRRPGVTLLPFWLETIYQRPELFQSDRLHPTVEGLGVLVQATEEAVKRALPPAPRAPSKAGATGD